MRWYWIDRFIEFESGRQAKAVKNVSLAEEHVHDHFPCYPMHPNSLVLEGLAQTGGLLVCEQTGFREKVILAKVPKARFYSQAIPGDRLVFSVKIEYVRSEGAMITGTSHRGDELHAEVEIVFAHLNDPSLGSLFDPATFLRMMRLLGAYEVGHAADGSPLQPPSSLLEAIGQPAAT
ncbi:MAG: 3-hydroxyacyl-ACP dehydratase FabZ family protein [Thermoguttaceae bacterium]|jgi:3-hydroxyacyl-[acyl-carrier-protein] dehydratase|nr:3-hydroxyacyl-ACP dehydratase FabZ family protein [Thermoguttaceae bacterium]